MDAETADEESTEDYVPDDSMYISCHIESSFDTEDVNNPVVEDITNVHIIEDPLVSAFTEARQKNAKSLITAHVNINSLKKEYKAPIDYFKDILQNNLVDILCISESKLDESIVEKDLDCSPQYKLYRKDRSSTSGGLVIWLRSDIPQQRMYHLEFDSEEHHIESIILELIIKKEKWYLILAYKNPNVNNYIFLYNLKNVYENVISKSKEIILLGDLNIDMSSNDNVLQHELCDIYNLAGLILDPTCFKKPEGTLIDHIIVRNPKRFKKSINVFCAYSDWHNMIGCITKVHIPPQKPVKVKYRSYKTFDQEIFKRDISLIPFHFCTMFDDISDQYWAQRYLFSEVLNEHAPLKERTLKEDHVPYMHSKLRKQIYKKSMLKNKHRNERSNNKKWEIYKTQRNLVTSMRRVAIKNHFMSKCKPGASTKDFFNAVGPFLSSKPKSRRHIVLKEDDHIITDTSEICNIFIKFFSTIANSIGPDDQIDMTDGDYLAKTLAKHSNHVSVSAIEKHHKNHNMFRFKMVSSNYVHKIINKLNENKATGFDNVPPKVVKMCADELSVTITELINSAFANNLFPDDMKKAELCPLFKKKDDMMKTNYRPVSILSVFSKVFEVIIAEQLMDFFSNIFNDMLCAYRKKYGCEHVLLKVIDSWKNALDSNKFAGTILIDLSKAFDCVPHGLLITKLKAYGLTDDACKFMSSYISGRFQRVRLSNEKSSWEPLLKGIPQGSGLGPIIFNIFNNDIFYFIEKCDFINYADDDTLSKVSSSIDALMEALKHDSKIAIEWFHHNFMEANPSKFQFMLMKSFTSKEMLPNFIDINDTRIERESQIKLLGITIDDKLKFNKHIDTLCKNAARQINVLYRFRGIFDIKEREIIHNTFILSNFNYCPLVWHFCDKSSTKKIEKAQERALRFLLNDKTSSYAVLLKKSNSTTLHIRRIKAIACEVFKSLNNLNPSFMKDMFEIKEVPYDLRDSHILYQPIFKKITYGKNTFRYHSTHIWNLLPNDLKNSTSISSFKDLIKTWEGPQCQCLMCGALN